MTNNNVKNYNDIDTFLNGHFVPKEFEPRSSITHTSMGGRGGSFVIPDDVYPVFLKLYKGACKNGKRMHLVERPTETNFLFVDVDMHFSDKGRLYTNDDIMQVIEKTNHILRGFFDLTESELCAYVHEKETPTCNKKYYKDGFHVFYPNLALSSDMRFAVLHKLKNCVINKTLFGNMPFTNKPDDVIDDRVVKANGILMYGSVKEENPIGYKVTKIYDNNLNNVFDINDENDNMDAHIENMIEAMSNRRFNDNDYIPLRSDLDEIDMDDINTIINKYKKPKTHTDRLNKNIERNANNEVKVKPKHKQVVLDRNKNNEIEFAKDLIKILDDDRAVSYEPWINICWALHNISDTLYNTFLDFSKRGGDKYDEDGCEIAWNNANDVGYTIASLCMWAKDDNPSGYMEILRKRLNPVYQKALTGRQSDMAELVHELYKHEYVCAGLKGRLWYQFVNNSWKKIEHGYTLYARLNDDIPSEILGHIGVLGGEARIRNGEEKDNTINLIQTLKTVTTQLGTSKNTDDIMKICAMKFLDSDFEKKLNSNTDLLGFNNGVYDLRTMTFRDATPDDYITFSVGYNYVDYNADDSEYIKITREIDHFISTIHTQCDMKAYFYDFAASCLRGVPDQKMHIWTGSGSNGKSVLNEFLKKIFGQYYSVIPPTAITRKRGNASGATPELAGKNGVRLMFMSEPDPDEKMNTAAIKALTGNETIYARQLFQEGFEFLPQFKIILLCNAIPPVGEVDNGTWRRFRVCPHTSEFVDGEPDGPLQFRKDRNITENFDRWKAVFMYNIINNHYKNYRNNGYAIPEPDTVLQCTKDYKVNNDPYLEYINSELLKSEPTDKIPITDLYNNFKDWFKSEHATLKMPTKKEVTMYIKSNTKHIFKDGVLGGFKFKG